MNCNIRAGFWLSTLQNIKPLSNTRSAYKEEVERDYCYIKE